jgi:diacylglycerol kinase family enzyme
VPDSFSVSRISSSRMAPTSAFQLASMTLSDPQDRCVYVQIDGEFAGRLPAEIRVVPDALTLLTPPEYGG